MHIKFLTQSSISFVYIILVCLYSIGCSHAKEETQANADRHSTNQIILSIPDTLNPGVLYPKVLINNDQLNSFALYLPKLYRSNTNWPVVFFFDSGGNGSLPLNKYKSLADSLGYIFIGSNVSKNGQQIEESYSIWNALKNSTLNNLSIDKNRILLAGFSGGARVCCALAEKEPNTLGVIANSAGAQQLEEILNPNTIFIGLCGNGDMNRAEMLGIEQHLLGTTLRHYYIEFEGIHEWATPKTMLKAISVASFSSYLKQPSLLNSNLVANFTLMQIEEIENLKAKNKWVDAYNELLLLNKGTTGINNMSFENIDSLKNNPAYLEQKTEMLKLNTEETLLQQEIYKLLIEKVDLTIWKVKIEQIRKKIALKNNTSAMYQRVLGYASLVCYSLSNRNIVAKNYTDAEKTVLCYEIADPENAEVYFFKSIISGSKKEALNTITFLKKSIQLNLINKSRILTQSEFLFLKNAESFKEIENKCQF